MRGLFTQTVALRLRSAEETVMVLGDGTARVAPAHPINPTHPGTAWVVADTGTVDRVRADYWPDQLIRQVAARHPSPVHIEHGHVGHGQAGQDASRGPAVTVGYDGRGKRVVRRAAGRSKTEALRRFAGDDSCP